MLSQQFLSKLFIGCILISSTVAAGQASKAQTSLYLEIASMDSVLFAAFNNRDLEKFKTLFTEDLEFYHDRDGLTGYEQSIQSLKNTAAQNNGLRRELVKGSLEVYPIPGYGAMQ